MEKAIADANRAVNQLAARQGYPPETIRLRPEFSRRVEAATSGSDRKLPDPPERPPASRLINGRGVALKLFGLAVMEAQTSGTRPGERHRVRVPARWGETPDAPNWIDLFASPAADAMQGRSGQTANDKKLLQLIRATRLFEEIGLAIPLRPFGGHRPPFQLLNEGGVRAHGPNDRYTIPMPSDQTIDLPIEFFTRGWVQVLEDTEIAVLIMLAHEQAKAGEKPVVLPAYDRIRHYGIGPDAIAGHELLGITGLVEVIPDEGRYPDGRVIDHSQMATPMPLRVRYHSEAFDQPAYDAVCDALDAIGD